MSIDTIRLKIPVSSRLTIPESRKLQVLATKHNITKSKLIRTIVTDYMEGTGNEIINTKNIKA